MIGFEFANHAQARSLDMSLRKSVRSFSESDDLIVAVDEQSACKLIDAGLAYTKSWTQVLPDVITLFDFVQKEDIEQVLKT